MQTRATLYGVRLSAQKGRLVATRSAGSRWRKRSICSPSVRRRAHIIKKVLESAIANAEHNDGADVDELKVKTILSNRPPLSSVFRRAPKAAATVSPREPAIFS